MRLEKSRLLEKETTYKAPPLSWCAFRGYCGIGGGGFWCLVVAVGDGGGVVIIVVVVVVDVVVDH